MSTIFVNGQQFTVDGIGSSLVIRGNGRVVINGKDITPDAKEITIEVHGDIERLDAAACDSLLVNGSVGSVSTQSGSVRCGDVRGSVQTMSGNVQAGQIYGSVKTMSGNIRTS